jgi:nicotinate-nucleotide adenylyltransferase
MIALFGGTFDPVHLGHINMANQCVEELNLSELKFLPCAMPVHKAQPKTSDQHRLNMLELITKYNTSFTIDTRELQRRGPSYSLITLQEYRKEYANQAIVFLMGMDSFNSLPSWFEWKKITELCHIVVYQRPSDLYQPNAQLHAYVERTKCVSASELHSSLSGHCLFLNGPKLDIASSVIRKNLKDDNSMEQMLSPEVINYVSTHQLYAE